MEQKFDLLVMILRGRLVHNGHKQVIDTAFAQAHNVLLLVGSANRSRDSCGNEFIAEETEAMLRALYPVDRQGASISIRLIDDEMHDEQDLKWLMHVQRAVAEERAAICRWRGTEGLPFRIGLIGFSKDRTSYYLKKFPQWESVNVPGYMVDKKIVSATGLRQEYFYADEKFGSESISRIRSRVPDAVVRYLMDWAFDHHDIILQLREAREFDRNYDQEHQYIGKFDEVKGGFQGKSYKPTHTTTDAVVIQSGHILLIRRKMNPGIGKWALPGGFLGSKEYTRDGVIRELKEETKLALPDNVLRLAFRHKLVFSDPYRSSRGRIITHAYLFLLNDRTVLPAVEGADDADKAEWVPLGELDPKNMHDDHFWIIMKMINVLPVD
jgi:bifunctional NMN adenylyltransferase/nudix hydrolase